MTRYRTASSDEIDGAPSMASSINQIGDSLIRTIEVMAEDRAMAYCEGSIGASVEMSLEK